MRFCITIWEVSVYTDEIDVFHVEFLSSRVARRYVNKHEKEWRENSLQWCIGGMQLWII